MKLISTTALAKELQIEPKELFAKLIAKGWIKKENEHWKLTPDGIHMGGQIQNNPKYGEYIVWPENIDLKSSSLKAGLNATKIGDRLGISNRKVNMYLSELGWILRDKGGRTVTEEGRKNGGFQKEMPDGIPYVVWSEEILENPHFLRAKSIAEGELIENFQKTGVDVVDDFRLKYPANQRTTDGHYVRSRAEMLIDNFLYYNKIVHAYEKKVNIDEPMFCDFFIPNHNIYIEFWGLEENEKYKERKKRKQDLYAKYKFKLIELFDKDLDNLDEVLSAKLRVHNVHVD